MSIPEEENLSNKGNAKNSNISNNTFSVKIFNICHRSIWNNGLLKYRKEKQKLALGGGGVVKEA